MILHVSKAFASHLKCKLSAPGPIFQSAGVLDSWSADLLLIPKVAPHAIVMNDASLSTIIVPLKGCRKLEDFFLLFLGMLTAFLDHRGIPFDPFNQSVVLLKRSDRSLIGSTNDAKFQMQVQIARDLDGCRPTDWDSLEQRLNDMPYSRIGYDSPEIRLRALLDPQ